MGFTGAYRDPRRKTSKPFAAGNNLAALRKTKGGQGGGPKPKENHILAAKMFGPEEFKQAALFLNGLVKGDADLMAMPPELLKIRQQAAYYVCDRFAGKPKQAVDLDTSGERKIVIERGDV